MLQIKYADGADSCVALVEEIDTMYLLHIDPRQSAKWVAPPPDQLVTTEKLARRASQAGADIE